MPNSRQTDDAREGWHLDKKVPVSIIFVIVVQCVSFTWFMGKQDARITLIEQSRAERIADQKDRDARQDAANADAFTAVNTHLDKIDSKLDRLIERPAK